MLLSSYDGVALDLCRVLDKQEASWEHSWHDHWLRIVEAAFCPYCLGETGGAWMLSWKLACSFACTAHGCLLVDLCPSCRGPASLTGRESHSFVSPSRRLPPTACRRSVIRKPGPKKRPASPCAFPLETADAVPLAAWPTLLRTQELLDQAISGEHQRVLDREVSSLEYLRDLRSLCRMILAVGLPEDIDELPPLVRSAFVSHVAQREEKGRSQKRPVVQSPALMAAALPTAVTLLASSSSVDLAARLKPYIDRVRVNTPHVRTTYVDRFSFSPGLLESFRQAWASMSNRRPKFQGSGRETPGSFHLPLDADFVPQLFWEDLFEEQFAELMQGIRKNHARRICSMALLRFASEHTWNSAALHLGIPGVDSSVKGVAAMVLMGRLGTEELFMERLRNVSTRIAENPGLINYGVRRRALSNFNKIADASWKGVCVEARVDPTVGQRRRYASAWLWTRLTAGDYRLSPAFADCRVGNTYKAYRVFTATPTFTRLEAPLSKYASKMLQDMSL